MTKKGKQPSGATLKGVSPKRAQDWITSVINPVVGALQRETRFLPGGPWFWHHRARRLELLDKIPAYVSEFYLPNLDDFERKHPGIAKQFRVHDQGIADLAKTVEAAFNRLMGPAGQAFREYALSRLKPEDRDTIDYFAAYIAGNAVKVTERFSHHEIYNSDSKLQSLGRECVAKELEEALEIARHLRTKVDALDDALVELRYGLADKYGLRIVPVDFTRDV